MRRFGEGPDYKGLLRAKRIVSMENVKQRNLFDIRVQLIGCLAIMVFRMFFSFWYIGLEWSHK